MNLLSFFAKFAAGPQDSWAKKPSRGRGGALYSEPQSVPTHIRSVCITPRCTSLTKTPRTLPSESRPLRQVVSSCVAQLTGRIHPFAVILFADLVGFTRMASGMAAGELVQFLDTIFGRFDDAAQRRAVEKIKTIGDCYMAVAWGAEERERADSALRVVQLAQDMHQIAEAHAADAGPLCLRAGAHGGVVVSGMIGKRQLCFDIWGDAVNVASRMESTGEPRATQVTRELWELLRDRLPLRPRGVIDVKGKGRVQTWLHRPEPEPAPVGRTSSPITPLSLRSQSRPPDDGDDALNLSYTCATASLAHATHGFSPRTFAGSFSWGRDGMCSGLCTVLDGFPSPPTGRISAVSAPRGSFQSPVTGPSPRGSAIEVPWLLPHAAAASGDILRSASSMTTSSWPAPCAFERHVTEHVPDVCSPKLPGCCRS